MIEIAIEAARAAGKIQKEKFDDPHRVRLKGPRDLVTEVDLACEEAIREILAAHTPDAAILGEEEGETGSGEAKWIVDPLDGTVNYAHGCPLFCVSIAYESGGTIEAGAIYDPLRDEMFTAEKGCGAFLNGVPVNTTRCERLEDSLLATGFPYDCRTNPKNNLSVFCTMTKLTHGVRRLGAAALDLAYVAAGRLDGFWEMGLKPWDVSAGALLVVEAGGRVTSITGGEYDHYDPDVAATNGLIHDEMLAAVY